MTIFILDLCRDQQWLFLGSQIIGYFCRLPEVPKFSKMSMITFVMKEKKQ